jgi:hypothetical protein
MLTIHVKADFKPLRTLLTGMERQMPFAIASALTQTAKDAQKALEQGIAQAFDRPVDYTRRGVGITPASKNAATIKSVVFLKRKQAAYLEAEVEGGARRRRPFEAEFGSQLSQTINGAQPGRGARLNAAGNMTQREIARIGAEVKRKGSKIFAAPIGGPIQPGIYERTRKGLKPLLIFWQQPARYAKRFDFYGIAERTATRTFQANFERAFQRAVATAR